MPDANGEFGPVAVRLDTNGRVVVGGGATNTGYVGVLVRNVPRIPAGISTAAQALTGIWEGVKAGDVVDVMTHGEIVDVPVFAAGIPIFAVEATGVLTATATANRLVGFMVETGRLVVRMPFGRAAGAIA